MTHDLICFNLRYIIIFIAIFKKGLCMKYVIFAFSLLTSVSIYSASVVDLQQQQEQLKADRIKFEKEKIEFGKKKAEEAKKKLDEAKKKADEEKKKLEEEKTKLRTIIGNHFNKSSYADDKKATQFDYSH
jgi:signal transduction histidine kinase